MTDREMGKFKAGKPWGKRVLAFLFMLVCAGGLAVILWFPVFRIYSSGMAPTLNVGDIVLSVKGSAFSQGDVVAFYYNDKILVKRVIAGPGDYVDIDEDGNVYVNGTLLDEPYLSDLALGDTDLYYPYLVPEGRWFLLGDARSLSLDSRNSSIGDIAEEQIIGKIVFRFWPLNRVGSV